MAIKALSYNSKVMFNLDRMLIDSVRVVPGTWRELRGQQITERLTTSDRSRGGGFAR